jgi:hypothetical protein
LVLAANSPGDEPLPEPAALTGLRQDYLQLIETIGDSAYHLYSLQIDPSRQ